jgi:hypothetical protein
VYGIGALAFSLILSPNSCKAVARFLSVAANAATFAISSALIPRPSATAAFCSGVNLVNVSLLVKSAIRFAVSSVIVLVCDGSSEGSAGVGSGSGVGS